MADFSQENTDNLPKWPTLLAGLALSAGVLVGLLALLNRTSGESGDSTMLVDAARWVGIGCGLAAAVIYSVLRKRNRARAALLGNLTLVGGLLALGAWQLAQSDSDDVMAAPGIQQNIPPQ